MSILITGRNHIASLLVTTGSSGIAQDTRPAYNSSGAYMVVGVSTCAEDTASTWLFGASSGAMHAMDATFPTIATNVLTFKATYTTSQACYAWNEWMLTNGTASGQSQDPLNRKLESPSLGTKTCSQSWAFTATLTITT
jgi:hypothetical protein